MEKVREYAKRSIDPFLSLNSLNMTVNLFLCQSGSSTARQWKCDQMEAIHCSIDQILSLYVHIFKSGVGQRTYGAVTATQLDSAIPARQLGESWKLSCSPGPTQALIIEASLCVLVSLDPHFGF